MNYHMIDCKTPSELSDVADLLKKQGLSFENKITSTIGFYDNQKMIATGSLYENVIKMIAVDSDYQNENLTSLILTNLTNKLRDQGIHKYFLFTTPKNKHYFMDYDFSLISQTKDIVLLENNINPIEEQLVKLKSTLPELSGTIASIVMNCNPVTLGHLYLIESCAKENDHVIIFLVEENKSVFPFDIRLKLINEATKHLENVLVIPSTSYIISSATFPTYFLKELNDASLIYMDLDITIFKDYFMRIFNIDFRYVGEEPLDPTTHAYNMAMKTILKDKLKIITRIENNQQPISASLVRKLAKNQQYNKIKSLVPKATYQFLISAKGKALFNE